ncbi:MAG TPA: hemolysin family protein [Candidatus Hydrogenedentes bacterium]|nr:hemolysin family protein [Candidatus Hydrogenedentota bacterium]HOS01908.1 hemolysin family protein [Candidatus Hydrogenedentota bacterium]
MSLAIAFALFFLTVLLQALFSGYETGFISTNPIRIRYLAEEQELPRAARLLRHIHRPDTMLTMLLIANSILLIVGTTALSKAFDSPAIATLIAAPTYLIFSEIVPKSIFRVHPNRLSLTLLPVIRVFYVLLAPVAVPIALLTRTLMRTRETGQSHINPLMTSLDDVRILVDESAEHGTIEREEQRMIHSVIDLQTTQAYEIMVPRIDMEALPDTATRQELLTRFVETGRTRIPIYKDTIDTIVGVVNAYDVLLDADPDNPDIGRFVREALHVPDTLKLDELLRQLRAAKQHMAIVTDEYGGTDGLVTIEDILEEIFGDIQDEHDREESPIRQVGPNAYVVDARMALEEAAEAMGIAIEDDEVETVGGWVMHAAGRIPLQGEVMTLERFRVTLLEGGPNCVNRIRVEIMPDTPPPPL